MIFGQTFQPGDLAVIGVLFGLEILLSADNALVLAVMVRHLPREQQQRALLYGLGGAFIFRLGAILAAKWILALWWLQLVGALYLLILPIKHFRHQDEEESVEKSLSKKGFWATVVSVEITDVAFAVDSVLAGVATIKGPDKLWVVYVGAVAGIIALRFAAGYFVRLMERYPNLDDMAYALVGWVGVKLAMMSAHNYGLNTRKNGGTPLFECPEMPPAVFWGVLALICVGGAWLAARHPRMPQEPEPEVGAEEIEALYEGQTLEPSEPPGESE